MEIIKEKLQILKGQPIEAIYDLGRNKKEYITGSIDQVYNRVFTIKTGDGYKSFMLADIVSKTIKIKQLNIDKKS